MEPPSAPDARPIRLVAYSDYLCPWCYNASVRLERLCQEEPDVTVEWRSYLLRPRPAVGRDLERFRAYTRSWERPAAEPDAGSFRTWASDQGPPSHSVPAHRVAKAAAAVGPDAFRAVHAALLRAYFRDSRDVSDDAVLRAIWSEEGLSEADFARREAPAVLERILAEHAEAVACGATGVPAVRLADRETAVTGALPYETYARWVAKERARRAARSADAAPAGEATA